MYLEQYYTMWGHAYTTSHKLDLIIWVVTYCTIFTQVFQYDGSQKCTSLEFGFFFALALLLAAFFVIPTPFAVGYVCIKRPKVHMC